MFPVEDPELINRICSEIIPVYLNDNTRARLLQADGTYIRAKAIKGGQEHRSQYELLESAKAHEAAQTFPLNMNLGGKSPKKRIHTKQK